ncbi:MAG TPA: hypothetical protein VFJ20_05910 [Gemmatimonadaceae bacterium]|nr:hypothetical protein [Gemmatimonadaceae bacterium]
MRRMLACSLGMIVFLSAVVTGQTLSSTTTLTAPTVLKITTVTGTTSDVTSEMATLTAPSLTGSVPNHGSLEAWLEGATVQATGQATSLLITMSQSGASSIWLTGSLIAANYHLRFNFRTNSGPGISSVTIHQGQLASGPVLATCPVTNSVCDVILSWPGGSLSLLAVIGGGDWSYFSNITIAPTRL